jgi:uncharacterized protein
MEVFMTGTSDNLNVLPDICKGMYLTENGQTMFLGNMFGSTYVAWHDLATGQVRVLYPHAHGHYLAGPSLLVSQPVEYEFTFPLLDTQQCRTLSISHPGERAEIAHRAPLWQEPFDIPREDALLSGTLYLPTGREEPRSAVVLVHGSGPQTRFMVQLYAETLCSWGIAALAYDKRGVGQSTGDTWDVSYELLADDAAAAVRLLRQDTRIDPNKVGLLGGSQAGWIMPLAAVRSEDVAFIVMLSGSAVSIAEQNVHNVLYNLRANRLSESDIQDAVIHVRLFNRVLCTGEDWELFQGSLEKGKSAAWSDYAWTIDKPPTKEEAESIRHEAERDPLLVLQQVRCPVLALFGGSDNVVPPKENVQPMKEAFLASGKSNYVIEVIPEATHTFLKSPTGADHLLPKVTHIDLKHFEMIRRWLFSTLVAQ